MPPLNVSTIAPPQTSDFLSRCFMSARHEAGPHKKSIYTYLVVCKGLSNDGVGVAKGAVRQETRPRAGLKIGDVVKKRWLGYRRTTPLPYPAGHRRPSKGLIQGPRLRYCSIKHPFFASGFAPVAQVRLCTSRTKIIEEASVGAQ